MLICLTNRHFPGISFSYQNAIGRSYKRFWQNWKLELTTKAVLRIPTDVERVGSSRDDECVSLALLQYFGKEHLVGRKFNINIDFDLLLQLASWVSAEKKIFCLCCFRSVWNNNNYLSDKETL